MEGLEDNHLIRLLQSRSVGRGRRGWRCPDETDLAAYVGSELDEHVRQGIEAHLADCDFCLSQVSFLLRLQASEPPNEAPASLLARAEKLAGAQTGFRLSPALRWGTVAAACLAVAVTLWLRQPQPPFAPSLPNLVPPQISPPMPPTGSPAPRTVRNGQRSIAAPQLLFPLQGSVVGREEVEFRWRGMKRSLFYEVRVVTEEGNLVWEARSEGTYARLPRDVRLHAGQKYFVWVRAYLPEGKTVKSKVIGFTAANDS